MDFQLVASGLKFPEGPVALSDGGVLVVEIAAGRLTRVSPEGKLEVVAELGGGPNGVAIGPDGAAYVCNSGGSEFVEQADGTLMPVGTPSWYAGGSIQRVDLDTGVVTTLYKRCGDVDLKGPNDIVFDAAGGFWFTDFGKLTEDAVPIGKLYYAQPDGSSIVCARAGMVSPNGVGLSPDGRTVHVAETFTTRVWCFGIKTPGILESSGTMWSRDPVLGPIPGYELFDSLAVEDNGTVCVATILEGGITRMPPEGGSELVRAPTDFITNICFGGEDMRDAWITASTTGRLYKARWPEPGLRLAYNR